MLTLSEQWNRDAALAEQAAADTGWYGMRTCPGLLHRCAEQVAALEQRLALAERRLAVLNRHRDGIHDSAVCFELPAPDWCYSYADAIGGGRRPAEQLADALELADGMRAVGGSDAEVEAALDAERDAALDAPWSRVQAAMFPQRDQEAHQVIETPKWWFEPKTGTHCAALIVNGYTVKLSVARGRQRTVWLWRARCQRTTDGVTCIATARGAEVKLGAAKAAAETQILSVEVATEEMERQRVVQRILAAQERKAQP